MSNEKDKTIKLLKNCDEKIKKAQNDLRSLEEKRTAIIVKALNSTVEKCEIPMDKVVGIILDTLENFNKSAEEQADVDDIDIDNNNDEEQDAEERSDKQESVKPSFINDKRN